MRGWTSIAGRIGAILLMLAAMAAAAQDAAAPKESAQNAIVLGSSGTQVPLAGKARFFIDTARQKTPDALEQAGDTIPWRIRETGTSYRIDGAALWFQFDVLRPAGSRWFLEVGSSGVDRVQLFWRKGDGTWAVEEAGDTKPVSEWPLPGRLPTFELIGERDKPVRYWVRIEHERVDFASPLGLFHQSVLFASRETEQFLLGGYFSLAVLIALVSIGNAIVWRDRNFGVYAVYVVALAAGQLAYLGVGAQHVWDTWLAWNQQAALVLPGVSAAAALWFVRTVTEPQRYSRALDLTVWAVIAALLSAVALDVLLQTRPSLFSVVALSGAALVVVTLLITVVWLHGEDPHVRLIALGFLPVLVMAIFPIMRGFNLIPISPLTRYGVSIGAALEMPILFYALSVRGNRRREATVRAAALSRNDTLTGLAHTRALLQKLEAALQRCATLKHSCALLAVKIANYESVIAEYGRDAAERALVVAASLLRGIARDNDTAARVGDHHFAVLLEGPVTAQEASSRAQQLVASGLRESDALPNGLILKFQVAAALLPERTLDADRTLDWLVDGVNAIRPDARKLIRPLNF